MLIISILKMNNIRVDSTSSVGELIGVMLAAQEIRAWSPQPSTIPNLWPQVRGRLASNKLEVCLKNIRVPVIENGGDPRSLLYPLHAALCVKEEGLRVPYDIVLQLVEIFPSALAITTELGFTPLHLAVILSDLRLSELLLSQYPDAVRSKSNAGFVPIHLAKSTSIARLLLEKFPECISIKDQYGNLPLHLALCHIAYEPGVVEVLLQKGIDYCIDGSNGGGGALSMNILSNYPLKVAIENVRLCLEDSPIFERDICWQKLKSCLFAISKSRNYHSGSLLHLCMGSMSDEKLLMFAMDQCEGEVFCTDVCGRYPLHIAAMNQRIPRSILCYLLKKYPAAASSFDSDSKLPLHYAISSGRKFDHGLKELVDSHSLALTIPSRQTKLFPFMMAAEATPTSIDSVYGLLRADSNVFLTERN